VNSRNKGKRGERQWRDELRANGYGARRGQQFSGSPDSPDVVCDGLSWIHFEVKAVERLNIEEAMDQARRDAAMSKVQGPKSKVPIVAHRRNFRPWLVTMGAEAFFRLLRGEFSREGREGGEGERGTDGTNGQLQMAGSKAVSGPGWPQRRD
jgi:Holliday junction resolvase